MRYLFEEYSFDTDRRELHRETGIVPVAPQVFDLLEYLIRNRERVVSKDDLIKFIWDGRIVSDAALTTRMNAARSVIGDSGEEQRLIRTLPRRGFRFVGAVQEAQSALAAAGADIRVEQPKPALPLPDKPSIAVLPFANLSSDPEQEYFADGMVEDIVTGLSRSKSLFVIARQSSFTYRGKVVDVRQVGRELGVRYVLEGSVRKSGNRLRVTGQLIDATTGSHLWADRFDSELKDIFELQDQVTRSVIGALFPHLERAEIERAKRKPPGSLQAYDYYLRALSSFYQFTDEQSLEAIKLCLAAVELDPGFAAAYALGAYSYLQRKVFGWRTDPEEERNGARRLARRAIELDKDDPVLLARVGQVMTLLLNESEDGLALVLRAHELDANLVIAQYTIGGEHLCLGDLDAAIKQYSMAVRLSPLDPLLFFAQTGMAFAHFLAGRYDDGAMWAKAAVRQRPNYLNAAFVLAACLAMSGRIEEARAVRERLMQARPTLRISTILPRIKARFRRPEHCDRFAEACRMVGIPE